MDPERSTYCTVVDKSDNTKYLCYFSTRAGVFHMGVTNASDVWSLDFTEDTLNQHMKKFALKSIEGCISKIRCACQDGSASMRLEDGSMVLQLGDTPGTMSVSLSRLSDPGSREELRDLIFRMAESLTHLNSADAISPMKNKQRGQAEFEPRRHQTGPVVTARKRVPGDSLINPGTRSKKAATGVLFDDTEDL